MYLWKKNKKDCVSWSRQWQWAVAVAVAGRVRAHNRIAENRWENGSNNFKHLIFIEIEREKMEAITTRAVITRRWCLLSENHAHHNPPKFGSYYSLNHNNNNRLKEKKQDVSDSGSLLLSITRRRLRKNSHNFTLLALPIHVITITYFVRFINACFRF